MRTITTAGRLLASMIGLTASLTVNAGVPGVPVLIYHQIVTDGTKPGETVMSLERFSEQMAHLAANGYTTLSVGELLDFMRGNRRVPAKSVVITFDDGWKSAMNAVPVLERHGFKASFWIITRKGIGWSNMEWSDVRALDAHPLFEVGSHTASHPWDPADNLVTWVDGKVPGKGVTDAIVELQGSRADLAEQLGRQVDVLAWPCGWHNDQLDGIARNAGYRAALTIEQGLNRRGDDPMQVRRTFIDGACGMAEFDSALRTGTYAVCERDGKPSVGSSPYTYR